MENILPSRNISGIPIKVEFPEDSKVHCRFCAELRAKEEILDLNLDVDTHNEYVKILSDLKIDFIDMGYSNNLPRAICNNCSVVLKQFHTFYKKMKQSQLYLSRYYHKKITHSLRNDDNLMELQIEVSRNYEATNEETLNIKQDQQVQVSEEESLLVETSFVVEMDDEDTETSNQNIDASLVKFEAVKHLKHQEEAPKPKTKRKEKTVYRKPRAQKAVKERGRIMKGSWNLYKWICFHCGVRKSTMDDLRTHTKEVHNICYGFKCIDCQDDFNTFNCFIEHVRRHRMNLRYFCQYCNERFDTHTECAEHAAAHWAGAQRACDRCGEVAPDQAALERHKRAYRRKVVARHSRRKGIVVHPEYNDKYGEPAVLRSWDDYEWTCLECCARLPSVAGLRRHTQELHNKCFSMKCVDCLLIRTCFSSFVSHVRRHRPLLNKFCPFCNSHIKDQELMTEHLKLHNKASVPPCEGCGQIFQTKEEHQAHMKQFDPPRKWANLTKDDLTCQLCGKEFSTINTLRNHKEIHDENREKLFSCKLCGKSFFDNTNMKNHMKLHSSKTEECPICHRKFHSKSYLKTHIKTHTDIKPFSCNECGKNFRIKRQLTSHMLIHTDIKPYQCTVCGKGFRVSNQLKVHEVQHTGIMPYSCKFCERKFGNWSNCNKHMIRKHGIPLAKTKMTPFGRVVLETTEPSAI